MNTARQASCRPSHSDFIFCHRRSPVTEVHPSNPEPRSLT